MRLSSVAQIDTLELSHKLLLAAYNNSIDLAIEHLRNGAKPTYYDDNGYTALMYAVQNNNEDMVKLLVHNGSIIDQKNFQGNTSLILASRLGFFNIAEYLCWQGASFDLSDKYWLTALHFAILNSDLYMADMLLYYGANTNLPTRNGNTAIHFAAFTGDTAIIKLLFRNNCNVLLKNKDSQSPIDIAIIQRNQPALSLLLQSDSAVMSQNLLTAINFHNDTAFNVLLPLISPDSFSLIPTQNPLTFARFQHQKKFVKQLKKAGFKESYAPVFKSFTLSTGYVFSGKDSYFDISTGLNDVRYQVNMSIGFGTRFRRKPILVDESDLVSYQYYERRNFINFRVDREFFLLPKNANLSISPAIELQYHFGNYRGSNRKFEQTFFVAPAVLIRYSFEYFYFKFGYQYADWKIDRTSSNWFMFGVGIKGNLLSEPKSFKAEWL
ncbi:MAG: ankyrin repeat domain-containing protein [Bacteroidales bacterium]|nr:ankyrin repeat domain-containing protein [Bacteroidales bacterium]